LALESLKNFFSSPTFTDTISGFKDQGISNIATIGFTFAFAFAGTYLYKRNPKSKIGRAIAGFLGAKVADMDLAAVLTNLKNKGYYEKIGDKIHNVLETGNIHEFATMLELEDDDAWSTFFEMKDVILDQQMFENIAKISGSMKEYDEFVKTQLPRFQSSFEQIGERLLKLENKIES
jgi:hypothetical protein